MRPYNPPSDPLLDVVYSDAHLLVLDKPSGLLSVPGRDPAHKDSLALRAQQEYPQALIVHRLDMDTSGLVVMALGAEVHRQLSALFQNRKVEKSYLARVWGEPAQHEGEVDLPLICDWPNRPRQKVCFESGKPSLTRWQKLDSDGHTSLLQLTPVTGRSHQLRVHMQALGHPILGDPFYAQPEARAAASRLLLHAQELGFEHPVLEKEMHFLCNPGEDFLELSRET
ncbi:bifunctional tRNA pseudouridine(32) synthase/23S rRNA pseudouridine(746) synthase RluA [Microbulbifer agarilyticus]|uniref:bifunctional tRNA pseudouridine(32) synthase/23S rRNA pseudouridine(746) synthase RluA n=1 Tax=Microbulbifer agarilyticus TaxID=260552 RepID=UPI001C979FF3|nr:bifunctional tRNA pseudouridine(32) synthase/23S rRNA pseudouridine(746) synthase RluA [Microbulbifer agarilyticus]MBY6191221.1 bifunctional tRNA pseudouridine(32) synthase/23S rRNA pseudouridine(746) synthase RluA [Microbulbifer agarilyticus]